MNRLNKTKVEKHPDLRQEKEDHLKELRKGQQAAQQERVSCYHLPDSLLAALSQSASQLLDTNNPQKKEEARIARERKEKKYQKDHAYDDIFAEENMEASSNQNRSEDWEDDFM